MKKYQGQTVLTIEDAVPCRNGCGAEPVLWRRGARRALAPGRPPCGGLPEMRKLWAQIRRGLACFHGGRSGKKLEQRDAVVCRSV